MDVMHNNVNEKYQKYLRSKYDIVIGGGCLIMKNSGDMKDENPFRFIILYNEIKENKGNEIDFFLYIKDKNERNKAVNYILQNNIWNYFLKIKYNYKEEYKKILNESGKEIGYIVRNNNVDCIEKYIIKLKEKQSQLAQKNQQNALQQQFAQHGQVQVKKFLKVETFMPLQIVQNNFIKDFQLDSVITFFYLIDELRQYLVGQDKNIDFTNFKNIIISKTGPDINDIKNYSQIFETILSKVFPNPIIQNNQYNQSSQFDEEESVKAFMKKHNKGNIIQKLLLIPKERKISCKKCGMNTCNFKYDKYVLIKNPTKDLLFQKIFEVENGPKKIGRECSFCCGLQTEYSVEIKTLDFPKWLIVLIESNQVNNFNLGMNLLFTNPNGSLTYMLNMFIEANTNSFYKINETNTQVCHKFNKKRFENPEELKNKKPIALFYRLMVNDPNNNQNTEKFF